VTVGNQVIDVPRLLDAINQRVEALYDRDHCIGHAYFTHLNQVQDGEERMVGLQKVFANRILPLLEEYFFEDWQKIRLVLADNQKPEGARFVIETQDPEDDLTRLFGADHGLDSYAAKRRYAMQEAAYSNPDAYIGIYQTILT
jgi:5-methylcytosine-specific restriction protein B